LKRHMPSKWVSFQSAATPWVKESQFREAAKRARAAAAEAQRAGQKGAGT
jgi:hypothetical protein